MFGGAVSPPSGRRGLGHRGDPRRDLAGRLEPASSPTPIARTRTAPSPCTCAPSIGRRRPSRGVGEPSVRSPAVLSSKLALDRSVQARGWRAISSSWRLHRSTAPLRSGSRRPDGWDERRLMARSVGVGLRRRLTVDRGPWTVGRGATAGRRPMPTPGWVGGGRRPSRVHHVLRRAMARGVRVQVSLRHTTYRCNDKHLIGESDPAVADPRRSGCLPGL